MQTLLTIERLLVQILSHKILDGNDVPAFKKTNNNADYKNLSGSYLAFWTRLNVFGGDEGCHQESCVCQVWRPVFEVTQIFRWVKAVLTPDREDSRRVKIDPWSKSSSGSSQDLYLKIVLNWKKIILKKNCLLIEGKRYVIFSSDFTIISFKRATNPM